MTGEESGLNVLLGPNSRKLSLGAASRNICLPGPFEFRSSHHPDHIAKPPAGYVPNSYWNWRKHLSCPTIQVIRDILLLSRLGFVFDMHALNSVVDLGTAWLPRVVSRRTALCQQLLCYQSFGVFAQPVSAP
jgi:hypothetical protein